jgi:hypothetical protein
LKRSAFGSSKAGNRLRVNGRAEERIGPKGGVGGISLSSLFSFCVGTRLAAVGVQLALLFIGQRENAALRNISAMDSHPSFSAKASKWAIWASVRRMPI